MPRKTNRPTQKGLENLLKKTEKAWKDLQEVRNQLVQWGGATEKISRWQSDIEDASNLVSDVSTSMERILERSFNEQLDSENYSWEH